MSPVIYSNCMVTLQLNSLPVFLGQHFSVFLFDQGMKLLPVTTLRLNKWFLFLNRLGSFGLQTIQETNRLSTSETILPTSTPSSPHVAPDVPADPFAPADGPFSGNELICVLYRLEFLWFSFVKEYEGLFFISKLL